MWVGSRRARILDVQHLTLLVDDHVAEVRQSVGHERRGVPRRKMLLDEAREIDVEEDVRVVHDERPPREERLGVFERAAGAEDRVLGEEDDPLAPGRPRGPRA